jgi:hypothetical protein
VVAETDLPPGERSFLASRAVRDFGLSTDIVVVTPAELVPLARSRARGLPVPRQGEGRAEPRPWRGSLHGTSCWFGALRAHVPRGKAASDQPPSCAVCPSRWQDVWGSWI